MHLSKELQGKLKQKRRTLLAREGDSVVVMRGPGKGKEGKLSKLSVVNRKAFVEGVATINTRGREVLIALEASNLMLKSLEPTEERKALFSEGAFKKPEKKEKPAPKAEEKPTATKETAESGKKGSDKPEKEVKTKSDAGKTDEKEATDSGKKTESASPGAALKAAEKKDSDKKND